MKSRTQIRRLTMAAMMGAVAFVLMYFSFSVPFLSPFADFDFSYLPELIGGYILGPIGAVQIIAVKILLKLVFKGTSSMLTGELQKFLLSCAYVLPSVIYYRRHKTRRGAAIGLVIGTVVGVCTAILTNVYLISRSTSSFTAWTGRPSSACAPRSTPGSTTCRPWWPSPSSPSM